MAFTIKEKEYAEEFLDYYSKNEDIPEDKIKYDDFIYGTETEKKQYLKVFIKDILLPREQSKKSVQENTIADTNTRISDCETYITA